MNLQHVPCAYSDRPLHITQLHKKKLYSNRIGWQTGVVNFLCQVVNFEAVKHHGSKKTRLLHADGSNTASAVHTHTLSSMAPRCCLLEFKNLID